LVERRPQIQGAEAYDVAPRGVNLDGIVTDYQFGASLLATHCRHDQTLCRAD
jgi:hypothetical protein